jgi:hypothetical protein
MPAPHSRDVDVAPAPAGHHRGRVHPRS